MIFRVWVPWFPQYLGSDLGPDLLYTREALLTLLSILTVRLNLLGMPVPICKGHPSFTPSIYMIWSLLILAIVIYLFPLSSVYEVVLHIPDLIDNQNTLLGWYTIFSLGKHLKVLLYSKISFCQMTLTHLQQRSDNFCQDLFSVKLSLF